MKKFKKVFSYFVKKNYLFEEIGSDIIIFKDVKWDDYYSLEDCSDICCVDVDYNYMNRKKYDVILVRNKKVLLSEYENKFNNKSVFGLLYNFRSGRWSVNDYSDRFENWCRRSGMLVKEIINDSSYKRRWLVK